MEMQQNSNFPCHLTMIWPDEQAAEWFEVIASEILRTKFRDGCLKVPGMDRTDCGVALCHTFVLVVSTS